MIIIILLLGASFWGVKTYLGKKAPKYKTAEAKRGDLSLTISASGEIKSDEEVTLKFQTSGSLVWVGVKKWDRVEKWQAIAALDKEELEKKLQKELSDYMTERWDYEQAMRSTYKDQAVTDTIKRAQEQTGFDLEEAVLDVEIADIALKYATLISPIGGIVTQIDTPYPGVNITPATAEFVISNPDKLVFMADVDEVDIGKVKVGQKAKILLDAYPEEEILSQVEQIEFKATPTSGGGTAFVVKFRLPENTPEEKFKLGMNGDIEIIIEETENVLSVPLEAVKTKKGKKFVEILVDEKAVEVEVVTGLETETEIEIIDGLGEGEKVITEKTP